MIGLLARLSRSLPLVIALIIIAVAIYFIVTYLHSKARAKEVLIKVFTVLCSAIAIFFALVSIYAVIDGSTPVFELAGSFAIVGLVGLVITRICNYFFHKNNPHYQWKAEKARIQKDRQAVVKRGLANAVRAFFDTLLKRQ